MRIARWSARLMAFTYDIQYKPGHENVTADCLSRLPLPRTEPSLEYDLEVIALTSTLTVVTSSEFKEACEAWEKVAIDITGPFDAAPADCRFVVTLVDYYKCD
ncbi:nuclear receptor ROR-alpha [Labeo rohita]|uniref:Nuclear receptor ROR-alpha n=1 Tax=Labeo rohita TaxID=84645 RepID=A0A498MZS3_LABRO|nr:nuclear receptor ROR-alpha [Labeo rohita]